MLLNMAVSKVYFKCNDSWYVLVYGLPIGIWSDIIWKFGFDFEQKIIFEKFESNISCSSSRDN